MASSKLCNPCQVLDKTVSGTTWCSDCEEYLCPECTSHHKSLRITRTHHLIDVKGLQQLPHELSELHSCHQHSELRVEYFCSFHDSICCRACLAEGHKSCNSVVALDLMFKDSKMSTLFDSEGKLKHLSKTLDVLNAALDTHNDSFHNQCGEVRNEIATAKARAVEQLNKQEVDLIERLEEERKQVDSDTAKARKLTKDLELTISERLQQIQFVYEHGTSKQAFLLSHILGAFIQNSEQPISSVLQNSKQLKFTLEENMYIIKTFSSLGSLKITTKPTNSHYTSSSERHAQIAAHQNDDRPLSSFKVTTIFKTNDKSNVLGMICTDDNRLLLCNFTSDYAILVYSEDGHHVQTITMKHKPYDIAEIPEAGQYVVTLPHMMSIQFFDKSSLKLGTLTKVDTKYKIYGIAASEQYIFLGGDGKIFKLNIKGSILKTISTPGWSSTRYLFIQNKTLIAASGNCDMMTIDTESDSLKQRYDRNVTDEPKLLRHIIEDKQGYIYVGGQKSGKIFRMTKDLKRDIVITDDMFRNIGAICFNKDCSKIFVSNKRGKAIVILNCS